MADNINGFTMHSFFNLPWKTASGAIVNTSNADDWSTLITKMKLLQFVVIDEVEAAGLKMLNQVNTRLQETSSRDVKYRKANADAQAVNRFFGGVNMLMSGDFFQLHPTGDIAIMTNPENPDLGKDQVVSAFFWDCVEIDWGLQPWPACRAVVDEELNQ